MTLEQFKKEKILAMKNKDKDGVDALNVIITKVMNLTIEKRAVGQEVTEGDVDTIIQKAVKELEEEREGFMKAGRQANVESLTKQIEYVKKYLPQLLSEQEIKEIISKLEDKSMPSIMKHFKTNYQGKVDMKLVSILAKNA
ncbi:MAG: GatB/YqeY domain-containing protein [Clostridia bacterium]|nr:GatB/YqeY domain-containing protein [Clostridia bacterium]